MGRILLKCWITPVGTYKSWTANQLGNWIGNNGGHLQSKITDDTTHLVVHDKAWKSQAILVKQALALNKEEGRDIKIVSYDWLEDSFNNKSKKREGPYLWEKLDKLNVVKQKKAAKDAAKVTEGPKDHVGLMAEMFDDATKDFVDEKTKRQLERSAEDQRRREREDKEEEKREKAEARKEEREKQAKAFGKGAKKARNEIFSENHHIYADDTGFKYDVSLTKVDTRHNRNERYALTIYESNTEPFTYAMNAQFAGTGKLPSNNVMAAIGCTFPTAFHVFKKAFKDFTGVHWDDRISFAVERSKREKRDKGQGTGSPEGTVRGVPVSDSGARSVTEEEDFSKAFFQYHPPLYGPRGKLPEVEKEKFPEVGPSQAQQHDGMRREDVVVWMSGANGAGPDTALPVGAQTPVTITQDDAELTNGDAMPARVNNSFGNNDGVDGLEGTEVAQGPNVLDKDLEDLFDKSFPFDNQPSFDMNGILTGQNDPTQPISFDHAGMADSFQPGTQEIGETQVAERAHGELEEFMGQQQFMDADFFKDPAYQALMANSNGDSGVQMDLPAEFDLGPSILGKRKASPFQNEEPAVKKQSTTVSLKDEALGEIPDSFDEQCLLDSQNHHHEVGRSPRAMQDDQSAKADEQLQIESQLGDEHAMVVS